MDVGDAVALLQHLEEVDEERVLDVDTQQGVNLAHVLRAKGFSSFQVNDFSTVGLYETSNRFYVMSSRIIQYNLCLLFLECPTLFN